MTPELAARLVGRWVRSYTRGLPEGAAGRRVEEIDADVHDHIAHERGAGTGERRIALGVLSRAVRGAPADASWRSAHATRTHRGMYGLALALACLGVLFLYFLIGAVGVIGETGDRADMMYLAVFAIALGGAVAARFRPRGMAVVLLAMAAAQSVIAVIALVAGKHESPITSVGELIGVNAMFVVLFAASAWLFRHAAPAAR
jgi:hypothetical protein